MVGGGERTKRIKSAREQSQDGIWGGGATDSANEFLFFFSAKGGGKRNGGMTGRESGGTSVLRATRE